MQDVRNKEAITAAVLKGHSEATVLVGAQCCGSQGQAQGPSRPRQPPGTAVTPAARSFFEITAVAARSPRRPYWRDMASSTWTRCGHRAQRHFGG